MYIKVVETEAEWEAVKAIRQRVFVEEQRCPPEEEWDEYDASSRHMLGYVALLPAATARWREVAHEGERAAKLERFAVIPEARGRGYGRDLVAYVVWDAREAGFDVMILHAQAHLERFYASFGFERVGEPFAEVGIPHVLMIRRETA